MNRLRLFPVALSFVLLILAGCRDNDLQIPAESKDAATTSERNTTSLGVPFPWPAEIDTSEINHLFGYSPTGAYMAVGMSDGSLQVIDLAAGVTRSLREVTGDPARERTYSGADWISGDVLVTCEGAATSAQAADVNPATGVAREVNFCYRGIRVTDGAELATVPLGPNGRDLDVSLFGLAPDGRWLVSATAEFGMRLWTYDPAARQRGALVGSAGAGERFVHPMAGVWLAKYAVPGRDTPIDPSFLWREPRVDLQLANLATGDERIIEVIPTGTNPILTDDGQYLIGADRDRDSGMYTPVVIDTATAARHLLPEGEHWLPLAVSRSRGVVLAQVSNSNAAGESTYDWFEIALDDVLP